MAKSFNKTKIKKEDISRFASNVYFETRKAIEFRSSKVIKK